MVVKSIAGHKGAVQHVCLWREGTVLSSTCDDDRTVRLWDLRSDESRSVRCVKFGSAADDSFLSCSCFGASDSELYIACGASVVRFDDRAGSAVIADGLALPKLFTASDEINELAYNAGTPAMDSGKPLLAAADDTGIVTVVRASDGTVYRRLDKQHTNVCLRSPTLFIPWFSTDCSFVCVNRSAARPSGTHRQRHVW